MVDVDRRDSADILVRLYDLPPLDRSRTDAAGITIRPSIAPEKHPVTDWIGRHFGRGWASETEPATANRPISCHRSP